MDFMESTLLDAEMPAAGRSRAGKRGEGSLTG